MDSILLSIKKLLGIAEEYTHFDADLILHTNSVLAGLAQIGVGPDVGFIIVDDNATWDELIPGAKNLELVKSYVYLKVRLLFDPPQSSAVMTSMEKLISELEWRITVSTEATYSVNVEE